MIADTGVLNTLPLRERRSGYAEIVKAGLIGDAAFYEWCETHAVAMLEGDTVLQAEAVERAVHFKALVVGDDERETKPNDGRALLNLGHTFAHALELETGYGQGLLHGEAVATGLVLATQAPGDSRAYARRKIPAALRPICRVSACQRRSQASRRSGCSRI